jgi:hypothetical protein
VNLLLESATHDGVTGLISLKATSEELSQAIEIAAQNDSPFLIRGHLWIALPGHSIPSLKMRVL